MAWMWWVHCPVTLTNPPPPPHDALCQLAEAPSGKVMQIFAGHAAGSQPCQGEASASETHLGAGVTCGCWGLGGKAPSVQPDARSARQQVRHTSLVLQVVVTGSEDHGVIVSAS